MDDTQHRQNAVAARAAGMSRIRRVTVGVAVSAAAVTAGLTGMMAVTTSSAAQNSTTSTTAASSDGGGQTSQSQSPENQWGQTNIPGSGSGSAGSNTRSGGS
jgi:hypothetical protein